MAQSYFQISNSINRDEVGAIPQIDSTLSGLKRKDIQGLEAITMQAFEFPSDIPTLKELQLEPDALLTDMLHTSFLSDQNGILISPPMRSIFEKFRLSNGQFYDAVVYDQAGKKHPYYFYFYIAAPELINYKDSKFEITDLIDVGNGKPVALSSFQDQVSCKRKIGPGKSIRACQIRLLEISDLFKLPMTGQLFISEQLKKALLSARITGMATNPSSIEFAE